MPQANSSPGPRRAYAPWHTVRLMAALKLEERDSKLKQEPPKLKQKAYNKYANRGLGGRERIRPSLAWRELSGKYLLKVVLDRTSLSFLQAKNNLHIHRRPQHNAKYCQT